MKWSVGSGGAPDTSAIMPNERSNLIGLAVGLPADHHEFGFAARNPGRHPQRTQIAASARPPATPMRILGLR